MTRHDFVQELVTLLDGALLDAVCDQRKGGELSQFLASRRKAVAKRAGEIYDQLCPPSPLPVNGNGVHTTPKRIT